MKPTSQLEHPCRRISASRPVMGDGTPTPAVLTRSTYRPRLAPPTKMTHVRQDASRQSLQPTCCHRAPRKPTNSRARDSHLADLLVGFRLSANTLVLVSKRRLPRGHRIARGHFRSRVMPRIGVAAPAEPSSSSPQQCEATPVFLGGCQLLRWGLVPLQEPNDAGTHASCHAAPTSPCRLTSGLRRGRDFRAATDPSVLPPRSSFRRAFAHIAVG